MHPLEYGIVRIQLNTNPHLVLELVPCFIFPNNLWGLQLGCLLVRYIFLRVIR